MWHAASCKTPFFGTVLFALAIISLQAPIAKSNSHGELILEVIITDFTAGQIGQRVHSAYLRVYSDGWAECRTLGFTGHEREKVKWKKLARGELQTLEAALDDPELLHMNNQKYGPTGVVIDSWTEWDIKVPYSGQAQRIDVKVDDFALNIEAFDIATEAGRKKMQSYPPALLKLGCLIWKVRNQIYGDETFEGKPFYLSDGCKAALVTQ
jgi:hypothetical protein